MPKFNQWIRSIIPDQYRDKDYFIEEVCFAALIHFWEPDGENGEASLRYQYEYDYASEVEHGICTQSDIELSRARHKHEYDELLAAYNHAKNRTTRDLCNHNEYEEDSKHLHTIIKYRGWLWT